MTEEGYVLLRYTGEEQKKMLKRLVVDGDFDLVRKQEELDQGADDDKDKGNSGLFRDWGSDYAGKPSEGVYQFIDAE